MENYISVVMQNLILILKMADLKKKKATKKTPTTYIVYEFPLNFVSLPLHLKKLKITSR